MDPHNELYYKALDYAWNTSKELTALATAIVGITVSFRKDVFSNSAGNERFFLVVAWLGYLVSLLGGLAVYGCITGEAKSHLTPGGHDEFSSGILLAAKIQMAAFAIGSIFVVIEATVRSFCGLGKKSSEG